MRRYISRDDTVVITTERNDDFLVGRQNLTQIENSLSCKVSKEEQ